MKFYGVEYFNLWWLSWENVTSYFHRHQKKLLQDKAV